jgi:riboflavin kinase/FMN adenylyltransferase
VAAAARGLGRPYAIAGEVTSGAGRGRQLGFPTANVASDRTPLIPRGVYRGTVHVEGHARPAVVNVGVRPTFGETTLFIEAHLLDFTGDLYGRRVRLDFLEHLREEMRFASVEALKAQVARDIEAARRSSPAR